MPCARAAIVMPSALAAALEPRPLPSGMSLKMCTRTRGSSLLTRVHRVEQHAFEADVRGLLRPAEVEREAVRRFDHCAGAQIERDADAIEARPEIRTRGGHADEKPITQQHVCHPELRLCHPERRREAP